MNLDESDEQFEHIHLGDSLLEVDESAIPEWRLKIYGRPITGSGRRRTPTNAQREIITANQKNRCLYCDLRIGTVVWRGIYNVRLQVNWDHFVPYSYGRTNASSNWVLACHICNGIKGCRMFETVVEAQEYIRARWAKKGYTAPTAAELAETTDADGSAAPEPPGDWEDGEPSYQPVPLELAKAAQVVCRRLAAAMRPVSAAHVLRLGGQEAVLRSAIDALIESGHVKRRPGRAKSRFDYWLVRPYQLPPEAEGLPDISWNRGGVGQIKRKQRSRFPGREGGAS